MSDQLPPQLDWIQLGKHEGQWIATPTGGSTVVLSKIVGESCTFWECCVDTEGHRTIIVRDGDSPIEAYNMARSETLKFSERWALIHEKMGPID